MSGLKLGDSLLSLARGAPLLKDWVTRSGAASVGKKGRKNVQRARSGAGEGGAVDSSARDAALDELFARLGFPAPREAPAATAAEANVSRRRGDKRRPAAGGQTR
jgi:hypothetical protein